MSEKPHSRGPGPDDDADAPAALPDGPAPDAEVDLGRLAGLLGYQLRRAEVAAIQSFNAHMAEFRISPGQLGVMLVAEANPGINQTRVGRALGIDRSTLVSIIDALEGRSLIARTPSASDRRSHALRLTRAGEAFLKALAPRLARHEDEIAHGLSPADRKRLLDSLARIVAP